MDDQTALRELLILHEGLRLEPYRCPAGYWTWGVGHNLEANPLDLEEQLRLLRDGPTREVAIWLLDRDVTRVRSALERALPWAGRFDVVRRAALVDMAFNMGVPRLLKFERTLAAAMTARWDEAAMEALSSRWAKQVGARAERIAGMLRSGRWPDGLST